MYLKKLDLKIMSAIIGVSAVCDGQCFGFPNGTTAYLMSMSRDGLLPKRFSRVHQNTKRHHMQQLLPVL
jgi:amino acid transporter